MLNGGGLTIKTTLDLRYQRAADKSVAAHVYPTDHAIGGLAIVEPGTGYVRALAQSRPMGSNKKKGETYLNYVVPQRYGDSHGFQAGLDVQGIRAGRGAREGMPADHRIQLAAHDAHPRELSKTCGGYYPSSQVWDVSNSTVGRPVEPLQRHPQSVNTFYAQLEQITGLCKP